MYTYLKINIHIKNGYKSTHIIYKFHLLLNDSFSLFIISHNSLNGKRGGSFKFSPSSLLSVNTLSVRLRAILDDNAHVNIGLSLCDDCWHASCVWYDNIVPIIEPITEKVPACVHSSPPSPRLHSASRIPLQWSCLCDGPALVSRR